MFRAYRQYKQNLLHDCQIRSAHLSKCYAVYEGEMHFSTNAEALAVFSNSPQTHKMSCTSGCTRCINLHCQHVAATILQCEQLRVMCRNRRNLPCEVLWEVECPYNKLLELLVEISFLFNFRLPPRRLLCQALRQNDLLIF